MKVHEEGEHQEEKGGGVPDEPVEESKEEGVMIYKYIQFLFQIA